MSVFKSVIFQTHLTLTSEAWVMNGELLEQTALAGDVGGLGAIFYL